MACLSELFQGIRQRPGLYFGDSPPLTCLKSFLLGHLLGCGSDPRSPVALPDDFTDWVAYRTGASKSFNWHGMLLSLWPDEHEAFQRFFDLLEEHCSRKGRLIAKVTGHGKFFAHYDPAYLPLWLPDLHPLANLVGPASPMPDPIFLTTYTMDPGFLASYSGQGAFGIWGYWRSWERFARANAFTEDHLEILDPEEFERIRR